MSEPWKHSERMKLWRNREDILNDLAFFDAEDLDILLEWHENLNEPVLIAEDIEMIRKMDITLDRGAYHAGYNAGKAGKFSDSCPYSPMTIESLSWHSAFIEGRADLLVEGEREALRLAQKLVRLSGTE